MMKYTRHTMMAVARQLVDDGLDPIDMRLDVAGIDPYITTVAASVGAEAAQMLGGEDQAMIEAATEGAWANGVLFGLKLAETEAAINEAVEKSRASRCQIDTYVSLADCEGLDFFTFEKVGETRMARIQGPFSCVTIDGNVATCDDGWLAVDSEGYLYPVADAVAQRSYITPA
jgi:hypothetical protein